MIDYAEARRRAQEHLDTMGSDLGLVLIGDQGCSVGWIFFYDSAHHIESGALADALAGNAPILVDREDGTTHVTGTAHPVEHYVAAYGGGATPAGGRMAGQPDRPPP